MQNKITATFTGKRIAPTDRQGNAREKHAFIAECTILGIIDGKQIKELVCCRRYRSSGRNSNRATAWVWVYTPEEVYLGAGHAGGYGYHVGSAAVEAAICNAGFTLSRSIDGGGERSIEQALIALAELYAPSHPGLDVDSLYIHHAHH